MTVTAKTAALSKLAQIGAPQAVLVQRKSNLPIIVAAVAAGGGLLYYVWKRRKRRNR